MRTYYVSIYQDNSLSHHATIRSDWTDAEWEHLEETFPNGYIGAPHVKKVLWIKQVPKHHPNWRQILPAFEDNPFHRAIRREYGL